MVVKDHVTNEERSRIQNASGMHDYLPFIVKRRKFRCKATSPDPAWHSEVNSADDSETSKERKTKEEMGREHQRMDGNGDWRLPEGSRRQGKVERNSCNVICGTPTTVTNKGLR